MQFNPITGQTHQISISSLNNDTSAVQGMGLKRKSPSPTDKPDATTSITEVVDKSLQEPETKKPKMLSEHTVKQVPSDTATASVSPHLLHLPIEILRHICLIFEPKSDAKSVLNLQLTHPLFNQIIKGKPKIYKTILEEMTLSKILSLLKKDAIPNEVLEEVFTRFSNEQVCSNRMVDETEYFYQQAFEYLNSSREIQDQSSQAEIMSPVTSLLNKQAKSDVIASTVKTLKLKCPEQAILINELQEDSFRKAEASASIMIAQLEAIKNLTQLEEVLPQILAAIDQVQNETGKEHLLGALCDQVLLIDIEMARQVANKMTCSQTRDFFSIVDNLKDVSIKAGIEINDKGRQMLLKMLYLFFEQIDRDITIEEYTADAYVELAKTCALDPLQEKELYHQMCQKVDLVQREVYKIEANLGKARLIMKTDHKKAQQLINETVRFLSVADSVDPVSPGEINWAIEQLLDIAREQVTKNPIEADAYIRALIKLYSLGNIADKEEEDLCEFIDLLCVMKEVELAHQCVDLFTNQSWKALALLKIYKRIILIDPKKANEIFEQILKLAQTIDSSSKILPESLCDSDPDKLYILLEMIRVLAPLDLNQALEIAKLMCEGNSKSQHQNFVLAHLEIAAVIHSSADSEQIEKIFECMLTYTLLIQNKTEKAKILSMIANQQFTIDKKYTHTVVDQALSLIKSSLTEEEEEGTSDEDKISDIVDVVTNLMPLYPEKLFSLVSIVLQYRSAQFDNYDFYTLILNGLKK